eukprot:1938164-Rhodomonas_salina.2
MPFVIPCTVHATLCKSTECHTSFHTLHVIPCPMLANLLHMPHHATCHSVHVTKLHLCQGIGFQVEGSGLIKGQGSRV